MQTVTPFLTKGVIRGYSLAEDDSEITDFLVTQKDYTLVDGADYTRPSPVYLNALTECDLLTIPVGEITDMLEKNSDAMLFYNRILTDTFNRCWMTQNKRFRVQLWSDICGFWRHIPARSATDTWRPFSP